MKGRIELWWSRLPLDVKDNLSRSFYNKHNLLLTDKQIDSLYHKLILPDVELVNFTLDEMMSDLKIDEVNEFENFSIDRYQRLVNKLKLNNHDSTFII